MRMPAVLPSWRRRVALAVAAACLTALVAAPARAPSVGESILQAVRQYAAGRPQSDDIALLCFGRD